MPQQTNLNVSPYYDDFDPKKNFYKVLFRPGYSVQTRELTTLQSVLQTQLESYGNYSFKQGELVIPGEVGLNTRLHYVKLSSVSEVAVNIDGDIVYQKYDIKKLIGLKILGTTSGVVASVIEASYSNEVEADTLYVNYETSGDSADEFTFRQGETLEVVDGVNTPILVVGTDGATLPTTISVTNYDTNEVSIQDSPAMGLASAVKVEEGIYFVNGYFVRNSEQLLVINKYYNEPSAKVGFLIEESIITEKEDTSLYDIARGSSNFASPGAHRLKIDLQLTRYDYDAITDKNFIELISIKSGNIQKKVVRTDYSVLENTLARRTYDESGDYVVDNFSLDLREYYQNNNNLGFYKLDDSGLVNGISEIEASSKMIASIGTGKAYVRGYEIVNKETSYLEVNKARDTISRENVTIKTKGLAEYKITNVYGSVPLNAEGGDLTDCPTVYLNSIFNDGSIGLNNTENASDLSNATFYKKTIDRRGKELSYTDAEFGSIDQTDIGFKTIYIKKQNNTEIVNDSTYPTELWVTTLTGSTTPIVTFARVVAFSVVKLPEISITDTYLEMTVYGRKDILENYFVNYNDDDTNGERLVFKTRNAAEANSITGSFGRIVDYNNIITPVVGICKPKNFSFVTTGDGFNVDKDLVLSKGFSGGKQVYNSTFAFNYFNPVFFTRILTDTPIVDGFRSGKYITGSISGAYAVVEGASTGKYSTNNIIFVRALSGEFSPGETIVDEDGNSLRIAIENTISHFIVRKKGSGYAATDKIKIEGVEFDNAVVKIVLAGSLVNRIQIQNRGGLLQEYSQPPEVNIATSNPSPGDISIEAVLFKNTVLTYNLQNVKSLFSAYGSSNNNKFTSDIDLTNNNFVETIQITEFTFSGSEGSKFIECNGFGADASKQLIQGDLLQFSDVDGTLVRTVVQYATVPSGTKKSRIYLDSVLQNDISNATVIRVRPRIENSSTSSLIYPTGSKEVSAIVNDITDTKISYHIRRDFVVTGSSSGGGITFVAELPFGTQRFVPFNGKNFIITVLDKGNSTTVNNGDIIYIKDDYINIKNSTSVLTAGSVDISFPEFFFGNITSNFPKLKLTATLEVSKAKPKLKTVVRNKKIVVISNNDRVIPLRGQDFDGEDLGINSYSDAFKLRYIYEGTVSSAPAVDTEGNLITGTDVTNRFTFDNGQRETFYDISRIILKPGFEQPRGQLVIGFDYFEHSQGDFCTVDSYLHESGVSEEEIPYFNSSVHGIVSLKDVFDFRPKADSSNIVTGFQDKSLLSQQEFLSFSKSGGVFSSTPASDDNLQFTVKFNESRYLDRIDGVFLDKKGSFVIKEGNSSLNPSKPAPIDDSIALYYLYIPAYTKSSKDVRIIPVDNRRYTMRDIGKLEKRIERLEYYTTLSILEQQALNMQIKDDIGFDRFKSGFIVDNFESHNVGNLRSEDYKCSIDTQQSLLRPQVNEDCFNLKEVYNKQDQREIAGYVNTNGVVSLPYTSIKLLGNNFATKTINPNPFVVLQYAGDLEINPKIDQWYDKSVFPLVTDNNTNLFSIFLAKSDVKDAYSSLFDSFITNWVGVEKVFFNISSFANINTEIIESSVNAASIGSSSNISPQNNELAKGVQSNTINNTSVISSTQFFARSIPVKFKLTRMKASTEIYVFMEGRNVGRWVNPDSRFTGIAGNSLTAFNSPIITDENGNASGIILIPAGNPPVENTRWTGDINIVAYDSSSEEVRFTCGTKTIRFTSDVNNQNISSAETYAEAKFYSTGITPQNPSTIISTYPATFKANEGLQLVDSNTEVEFRPNPLAQTFKVENYDGGVFVTGVDLFFNKKSNVTPVRVYITNTESSKPGKYIVPGTESVVMPYTYLRVYCSGLLSIKSGEVIKGSKSNAAGPLDKVYDNFGNELTPSSSGEYSLTNEQIYTLALNNYNGSTFIQNEVLEVPSLTLFNNANATDLTVTIAKDSGKVSRLVLESSGQNYQSATITIESPQLQGGSNSTGIVSVSNGKIYDTELILPGSGYTDPPSVVIRGVGSGASGGSIKAEIEIDTPAVRMGVAVDDGSLTDSTTPTRFNFQYPVYLQNNSEYALTIETDSIDYQLWTSRLGETEIATSVNVSSQPLLGSVYKSQNIGGWTEDLFEDIKFSLYRAEFNTNRSAEVLLTNQFMGMEKLPIDPLETYSFADSNASSDLFKNNNFIVKVNHNNHSFEDKNSFTFFKSLDDVGGLTNISMNNTLFNIIDSGTDFYTISAPTRANSTLIGGGSSALASYNRKYEKLYAQIGYLQVNNTFIDSFVKTTNVVPIDSNTQNYISYSQSDYEKTFINQTHYFTNQKILASRINEVVNNVDRSLTYKLNLSSDISYLSPIIDLRCSSVKLSTTRLENPTGFENRFGKRYQIIKFYPVYKFTVDTVPTTGVGTLVSGDTSGASGIVAKISGQQLFVKTKSSNAFLTGENITYGNDDTAKISSTASVVEEPLSFKIGEVATARNPQDLTIIYQNKITGTIINWDPKTKELFVENDKQPLSDNYFAATNESGFTRATTLANQSNDIFRVGDFLTFPSIEAGNERYFEIASLSYTTGTIYSKESNSKNTSGIAKYLTKEVSIESPGTSINVKITANVKDSGNVKLYYRTKQLSSQTNFDDIDWIPFNNTGLSDNDVLATQVNTISGQFESQNSYQEFNYSVSNLPEFNSFAIKIIMQGDDPVYSPKIQDVRAVASY